jgi:hypothetical protein
MLYGVSPLNNKYLHSHKRKRQHSGEDITVMVEISVYNTSTERTSNLASFDKISKSWDGGNGSPFALIAAAYL